MTSTAAHLRFDPKLDDRQILRSDQLERFDTNDLAAISTRLELVFEGDTPVPHVDIAFHSASRSRLIVALGIPIYEGAMTWPASFSAWPETFLRDASVRALRELKEKSPRSGQPIFLSDSTADTGPDLQALLTSRPCPGFEDYWSTARRLWRYRFAASNSNKGRLLEVGCGAGFGAGLLCNAAGPGVSYLGLDPDPDAIRLANLLAADEGARFLQGTAANLDAEQFDCILSFDTLARAADPEVFLETLKRRLAADGRLIISLPCERWHGFHANRGHWSSWNLRRIRKFIEPHFESIRYYGYERPQFTENAFTTGRPQPLDSNEDPSRHEGYLLVLEQPLERERRRRIVIQRRYARGDALQATPIVHALRNRHRDHQIVVSTDVTEVFMNNPDVDLLMATSSGFRPRSDDVVVNLDTAYEKRPDLHILDAYVRQAREPIHDPRLRLFPNRWDYQAAGRLLEHKAGAWQHMKYLIAVHLCTTPDRSWPADHWIKFLNTVAAGADTAVLVVGAGSDMVVNDHQHVINCVNKADFLTTAALISLADCVIGPDSSLLHVAASMGTLAIGLYGMVLPQLRIPYGAAQSAITAPVECAGCLKSLPPPVTNPRCKFEKSFCMEAISPDAVLERLQNVKAMMQEGKWARRYDLMKQTAAAV